MSDSTAARRRQAMSAQPELSDRQQRALVALRDPANVWREGWVRPGPVAQALGDRTNGAAVNTLNALVRRGLADWSLESLILGYPTHKAAAVCGESVYRPTPPADAGDGVS